MWHIVLLVAQALFIPGLLRALLDPQTVFPRSTSGLYAALLAVVAVALWQVGEPLGALSTAGLALVWALLYWFRGVE